MSHDPQAQWGLTLLRRPGSRQRMNEACSWLKGFGMWKTYCDDSYIHPGPRHSPRSSHRDAPWRNKGPRPPPPRPLHCHDQSKRWYLRYVTYKRVHLTPCLHVNSVKAGAIADQRLSQMRYGVFKNKIFDWKWRICEWERFEEKKKTKNNNNKNQTNKLTKKQKSRRRICL